MFKFRSLRGRKKQLGNVSPEKAESSQLNSGPAPRHQKVFHTGIKSLYEPDSAIADVVFVHGLTGDREGTWKVKAAVSSWPQTLLPAKLPQIRVLTFGYDANVADWRGMVSKNRIGDHARNLLTALTTYRENDETDHRPIFFVAHSLGGLVCEDALLASRNSADEHLQNILPCTKGICFLGTPHAGAGLAHWAEMMAKSIGFIKQTNSQIIEVLKSESEVLARIQTEFHTMLRARAKNGDQPIEITCFYEELPLPGIGTVVPMHSANLAAYTQIGIRNNHKNMARFEVEDDPGFIAVTGELRRWVRKLSPSSVTDRKPTDTKLSSSKTLFSVSYDRDLQFVGRDDIISQIGDRFQKTRRVAIAGTGGVGKSQIAIEYCHRFRESHPASHVFWIYCATVERYKLAYQDIARKLSMPGWDDPQTDILKLVSEWLSDENHATWLMILDNADDSDLFFPASHSVSEGGQSVSLASSLPRTSNGFILVTTRDNRVGWRLTDNDPISVLPFDLHDARQLLQSKLPENKDVVDEDVENLLHELECLPLAITQAAAFIHENSISVAKYISMLQEDASEFAILLDRNIPDLRRDLDASNSVLQTWKLSFDQIQREQPRAAELLSLMAQFDRQGIPKILLQRDKERESGFFTAAGILQAFSLISTAGEEGNYSLHRLVQLFTTAWLEIREEKQKFQEQALQILSKKYPNGDYENWKTCELLAPHVQVVLTYHPSLSESSSLHRAALLYHSAWFGWRQGRYDSVYQACEESYIRRRDLLGESNSKTLDSLDILASILADQGKYDEAETKYRQTLKSTEKLLGKEHSDTATSMNNLAILLHDQGKYDEAETMHRQTLILREKLLGKEHPDTLQSMNNLTLMWQAQGKYDEIETMHRQTLILKKKLIGKEHPDTLRNMNNLTLVWQDQSKYDEAETMYRQILILREKVLGKEHPDTLQSVNNLTVVLRQQGKYDEAETMHRQTLILREKLLGKEHPDTLQSMNNLAVVWQAQGKYDEAETMYRQILILREKVLGNEHPETLISMRCLATVLRDQGKYDEAEELFRKTLKIREKVLGVEHLDIFQSVWELGYLLYCYRDRCEEGFNLCQSAYLGLVKILGERHPHILSILKCLDWMREEMNRISDDG